MGAKIGQFATAMAAKMIPLDVYLAAIIKLIGAAAGAALALVFSPPRTWGGFWRRLAAALIFGFVFAPYVRGYAGFSNDWEGNLGAATLAAFVSWAAMSTIIRLVQAWQASKSD